MYFFYCKSKLIGVSLSYQQTTKHLDNWIDFTLWMWYTHYNKGVVQMALSNEDLLAISQLLDIKLKSALQAELQPLKDDIRYIKLHLENETDKSIQLLAENYVPAAKRYEKAVPGIEAILQRVLAMQMPYIV